MKQVSMYGTPVTHATRPIMDVTISDVFGRITSEEYKNITEKARTLSGDEYTNFKNENFSSVTFSGTFDYRNESGLREYSGLICLDFDDIGERLNDIRSAIIADESLPLVLLFVSPSGDGLKVVLKAGEESAHKLYWELYANYFKNTFDIDADTKCTDTRRLCFLCYDKNAYYNEHWEEVETDITPLLFNGGKAFKKAEKVIQNTTSPIPTGFSNLDQYIGGGLLPGVYCIGGAPGMGKTTFMNQIIVDLLSRNVPVIYFSLEMTEAEIWARLMSNISAQVARKNNRHDGRRWLSLSHFDLLASKMEPIGDKEVYEESRSTLNTYKERLSLYTDEVTENDILMPDVREEFIKEKASDKNYNYRVDSRAISYVVADTRAKLDSFGKKYLCPVVFVDYLQKVDSDDLRMTEKEKNDVNIRGLKEMSKRLGVPVVLVSTLNRVSYYSPFDLSMVKESGGIEYECDFIAGLQLTAVERGDHGRTEKTMKAVVKEHKSRTPRLVSLSIVKNRNYVSDVLADFEYFPAENTFFDYRQTVQSQEGVQIFHSNENIVAGDVELSDNQLFNEKLPTLSYTNFLAIIEKEKYKLSDGTEAEWESNVRQFFDLHSRNNWKWTKTGKPVDIIQALTGWERVYRKMSKLAI